MSTNEPLPRRTIQELIQVHRLEPTVADVIVEGPSDQKLVEWFLSNTGVAVYPVSAIDVPVSTVLKLGFEDGNRGRVMTLAKVVSDGAPSSARCCFIIDRDLDAYVGLGFSNPRLVRTDFTSMELYAFEESTMNKFLLLQASSLKRTATEVLGAFSAPLRDLFSCRVTVALMELGIAGTDWTRLLALRGSILTFDVGEYVKRCLNKGAHASKREAFETKRKQVMDSFPDDSRFCIHGRDFLDLFAWYLGKTKVDKSLRAADNLKRQLYTAIERSLLEEQQLFKDLRGLIALPRPVV